MLDFKKIKQKLNVIWTDFIYFLSIFKISNGFNGFLDAILHEFLKALKLISSCKIISIIYLLFLFVFGYFLWLNEFIAQSNMISSFTFMVILVFISMIVVGVVFTFFSMFIWFITSLQLKEAFKDIFSFLALVFTLVLFITAYIETPVHIDDNLRWFFKDVKYFLIVLAMYYLIVLRFNIAKLYESNTNKFEQNLILKRAYFVKLACGNISTVSKFYRVVAIFFLMPWLIFQTTSYKIFLLSLMYLTNLIPINNLIPLNYQQYQLLQPQKQDCKIDKYTLDLIAKHQISEDKQVCIQSSNILKQGFADEYILIAKKEDNSISKIYCINNKCNGVSLQNKELAEILMNPTFKQLSDYFFKH